MERAVRSRSRSRAADERAAGSFLVRIWYESREIDGGTPAFRGYVKNLQTGEERFLRDPDTVKEHLLGQIDGARGGETTGRRSPARENGG